MNSVRKTSLAAGILIVVGMLSGVLSVVPSVESANYLVEVSEHRNQVLLGACFQFLLVPIYIGYALVLFPILKKDSHSMAIGFVSSRVIAGVFQIVGVILLPLFILLSDASLNPSGPSTVDIELLGELLKEFRDLANHMGVMLATGLGNLVVFYLFYRTRLVPRWLSGWGFVANTLAMVSSFLILLGLIEVISTSFAVFMLPLVVQEVVLSGWLIVRGFADNARIFVEPESS